MGWRDGPNGWGLVSLQVLDLTPSNFGWCATEVSSPVWDDLDAFRGLCVSLAPATTPSPSAGLAPGLIPTPDPTPVAAVNGSGFSGSGGGGGGGGGAKGEGPSPVAMGGIVAAVVFLGLLLGTFAARIRQLRLRRLHYHGAEWGSVKVASDGSGAKGQAVELGALKRPEPYSDSADKGGGFQVRTTKVSEVGNPLQNRDEEEEEVI